MAYYLLRCGIVDLFFCVILVIVCWALAKLVFAWPVFSGLLAIASVKLVFLQNAIIAS